MTQQEKFNYWFGQVQENNKLIFAGALLQRAAQRHPCNTGILCNDESLTYQELYRRAVLVSKKIAPLVSPEDRIVLLCENSPVYHSLYYGIWQTGAVIVPVNIFFHEQELAHVINDCKPKLIIISSKFKEKIDRLNDVPMAFTEADFDFSSRAEESWPVATKDPDTLAAILYTSGTTGLPKGVMLSSRNILMNVVQGGSTLNTTTKERIYAALPLFHSYMQNTCLWSAVLAGATVILVPKIDRKLLLAGLAHRPTVVLGIPNMYGLFCMFKNIDFSSVNYFICGGDALPDKIRMAFSLVYRRKICNGYGLTESSPFISVDTDDMTCPTSTVGRPVNGIEISLRDDQGNEVARNQIGILWIRGENVMLGYYNAPEATANVLKDGWLNTGDLATIDQHGRIIICGRERDLIVNKGIKIYPQEVENVIMSHSLVVAVGVVGMPDHTDETPVAFVAIRESSPNIAVELKELCTNHLAAYKIPRQFFIERELPMTTTGKVDKKVLRARLQKQT